MTRPCRCAVCQADRWAHRLLGFVAGLVVAYLLWGVVATIEASRPAQPTEVRVDVSAPSSSAGRTGAPRSTVVSSLDPSPVPVASDAAGAVVTPAERTPIPSARPSLVGLASWYDDGPGIYAAMHAYRWGMAPYPVVVCAFDGGRSACITVHVVDHCYCRVGGSTRLIDLSPAAFAQLAPLSRGLVKVSVEVLR